MLKLHDTFPIFDIGWFAVTPISLPPIRFSLCVRLFVLAIVTREKFKPSHRHHPAAGRQVVCGL